MWTLGQFVGLDWAVLGGYFALLAGTGVWLARRRRQASADDYFLAGRRMPMWAAAASVMATSLSAATFIAVPQSAYGGDLTYLINYVGLLLAAFVVAWLFMPAFYRHGVSTVYELLGHRYGVGAKRTASAMFMVGRVFASGARLFIGALAGALILFGSTEPGYVVAAVGVLVLVGIVYTFVGGIAAVVWADVIQSVVFVGAAVVAIGMLLWMIPADLGQVVEALRAGDGGGSKLRLVDLGLGGVGAEHTFTLLTAVFGFTLIGIGSYGTDQDLTQRMLTCRTARSAGRSAIGGIAVSVPIAGLFMVVGLLLWVFYQRPELMGSAAPAAEAVPEGRDVFVSFVLSYMPAGVSGLMMAGLFAAALSSLNSELNAMSSTLVNDFYRSMRPGREERHYLWAGRLGVIVWGVALGGFAVVSVFWHRRGDQPLIDFSLGVMTFAYSGLVGVFLAALLTRRGSGWSVIAALATGFVVVALMNFQPWAWVGGWGRVDVAFPWVMVMATGLAFAVCVAGKGERGEGQAEELAGAGAGAEGGLEEAGR